MEDQVKLIKRMKKKLKKLQKIQHIDRNYLNASNYETQHDAIMSVKRTNLKKKQSKKVKELDILSEIEERT